MSPLGRIQPAAEVSGPTHEKPQVTHTHGLGLSPEPDVGHPCSRSSGYSRSGAPLSKVPAFVSGRTDDPSETKGHRSSRKAKDRSVKTE